MYVACTLTTLKDVPKLIATSRACHQRVGRHARARAAVRTLPSPRLASGRFPCPPAARGWLRGPRGGRAPRPFAPWGPRRLSPSVHAHGIRLNDRGFSATRPAPLPSSRPPAPLAAVAPMQTGKKAPVLVTAKKASPVLPAPESGGQFEGQM